MYCPTIPRNSFDVDLDRSIYIGLDIQENIFGLLTELTKNSRAIFLFLLHKLQENAPQKINSEKIFLPLRVQGIISKLNPFHPVTFLLAWAIQSQNYVGEKSFITRDAISACCPWRHKVQLWHHNRNVLPHYDVTVRAPCMVNARKWADQRNSHGISIWKSWVSCSLKKAICPPTTFSMVSLDSTKYPAVLISARPILFSDQCDHTSRGSFVVWTWRWFPFFHLKILFPLLLFFSIPGCFVPFWVHLLKIFTQKLFFTSNKVVVVFVFFFFITSFFGISGWRKFFFGARKFFWAGCQKVLQMARKT